MPKTSPRRPERGAARAAGGGPCDGASSPVVPAHGRVTHASSERPVEPTAGEQPKPAAALRCGGHGTARAVGRLGWPHTLFLAQLDPRSCNRLPTGMKKV